MRPRVEQAAGGAGGAPPSGWRQALPALAGLLAAWAIAGSAARADVQMPVADIRASIRIDADAASRWQQGVYEVWHLRGNFRIQQAELEARGGEAVLWIRRGGADGQEPTEVLCYLEHGVRVVARRGGPVHAQTRQAADVLEASSWFGRFDTAAYLQIHAPLTESAGGGRREALERGQEARRRHADQQVRQAQLETPAGPPHVLPSPGGPPAAAGAPAAGARRIRIMGRSGVAPRLQIRPGRDARERLVILDQGVQIVIEGLATAALPELGDVVLQADRILLWTDARQGLNLAGETVQSGAEQLEVYMEGNIVFKQGDRVVYAERMYYNVPRRTGVLLSAEAWTPVPEFDGLVRLKAAVLQQLDEQNLVAHGAAMTTSRLGVPRYWLQSDMITFQDRQSPRVDPATGQLLVDPATGQPAVGHDLHATSRNNFLYVLGAPVAYWPVLASDVTEPTFYLQNLRIRNDNIFGTQVLTDWNVYQLLGATPVPGTRWQLSLDYLSKRGPAAGTNFTYQRDWFLWFPGPVRGEFDAWGIRDTGLDTLGLDRRNLEPDETWRGRARWQHRQTLPEGFQFTGQFGWISDRNFLEQYFEHEWNTRPDQVTRADLKRYVNNSSWNLAGQVRLNEFFTETEWLPRLDHFLIGQSLLWDQLTWHAHSHVGYARLRAAEPPSNPVELAKWDPLPWEADREGLHAATRHELGWPVELGPLKMVPYALGELAYWGEDLGGQSVTRHYGQLGVRGSLPMWSIDPTARSLLLNVDGVAHKVALEGDFFWAEASEDLSRFPLYEQLDDNQVQHFRRRFFFDTFGGMPGGSVPLRFDERYYALRTGMQGNVTAASTEIADDLMLARLAVRQRWQTKRGLPGQQRIVDWVALDVGASLFPKPERDNFGQEFGLLNYDFRWNVGDRLAVLSDGHADLFADGLRTTSLGGQITRPGRGSAYLGMRTIDGPFRSHLLLANLNYRMNEKWIATAATSYDFGPTGSFVQWLGFTRIGESALVRLGMNIDEGRDSVGVALAIEPRFLPRGDLGVVGGQRLPPVGAFGLE